MTQAQRFRTRLSLHWILLGSVLLVATALRLYKIDAQSLWYDEGNSARIAERTLALIIAGAAGDIHPPLYYIVLKYWRAVFGASEAGLRSLSAACGVLTVGLAYLAGRDLFNRRVGLGAAFLLAVAPFAVYYGQEARMYAPLALCAAASTWALIRLALDRAQLESGLWQWSMALVYIAATAAGLWTQFAYPFVMLAQGLAMLLLTLSRARISPRVFVVKTLAVYALTSLVAMALFAPWVPIAIRQITGWGVAPQHFVLSDALLDALRTLVVGRTLPLDQAAVPLILVGALLSVGLAFDRARFGQADESRRAGEVPFVRPLAVVILAFLPLGLLFVFGLYRDAYLKVLLVCVLPICLLTARGMEIIGDWAGTRFRRSPVDIRAGVLSALALGLSATWVPSLNNLYNNPSYARDDYRAIQRLIASDARPDDAIIFVAPNQWEVFTYYQKDDHNLFPLGYKPQDYAQAVKPLETIAASHTRLFVLYFAERDADPDGWYEQWLNSNTNKAHEQWIGNIRLAVYASGVRNPVPWIDHDSQITFGPSIHLDNLMTNLSHVHVGDVLPINLIWHSDVTLQRRYKVFIHVGPDDGPPVAQNDGEPVGGIRPTPTWNINETLTDRRGVWIRGGKAGDALGVYVGIYDAETAQRLPIFRRGQAIGDRLKIGVATLLP